MPDKELRKKVINHIQFKCSVFFSQTSLNGVHEGIRTKTGLILQDSKLTLAFINIVKGTLMRKVHGLYGLILMVSGCKTCSKKHDFIFVQFFYGLRYSF